MQKLIQSKKIKSLHIENGFLIGSVLLYPQEAKDADIVLLSKDDNKAINAVNALKFDFKIKFRLNLHVTFFESKDDIEYDSFVNKNKIRQAL